MLLDKTKTELIDFRSDQEKLISQYDLESNLEMAFLVRWSILEKFVKTVTIEYRRCLLHDSLRLWLSYIEKGTAKPKNAPKTALEANVLPKKPEFIAALDHLSLAMQQQFIGIH